MWRTHAARSMPFGCVAVGAARASFGNSRGLLRCTLQVRRGHSSMMPLVVQLLPLAAITVASAASGWLGRRCTGMQHGRCRCRCGRRLQPQWQRYSPSCSVSRMPASSFLRWPPFSTLQLLTLFASASRCARPAPSNSARASGTPLRAEGCVVSRLRSAASLAAAHP